MEKYSVVKELNARQAASFDLILDLEIHDTEKL
jgi:hypothetical protein